MARIAWLVLASLAAAAAYVLLASGVTVHHEGEAVGCSSVIGAAAADPPGLESRAAESACHDALVRRTELAGLLVLVCICTGTVATFQGRPLVPAPAAV